MSETRDGQANPSGLHEGRGEGPHQLGIVRKLLVAWLRSRRHHAVSGAGNGFLSPEHSVATVLALHCCSLSDALRVLFRSKEYSKRQGEAGGTLKRQTADGTRLRQA